MNLARRWTSDCLESHTRCNLERPLCYPSRLLSIARDPIQLVITKSWPNSPGYATLSHCWGEIGFQTLKSTNIEDLGHGVPRRFLTKTFLDAVQITREVGLKYLWIDSLCIIQDSNQDWEAEASMMASVYGGSSLNIAASSAKDGTEGCFLKPQQHCGGFTARVSIAGRRELYQISHGREYKKSVTESHLASRAWSVQEKVLAPRTLHCGDQGFFWECRSLIASEYFPGGFSPDHFVRNDTVMLSESKDTSLWWDDLKEWYSRCNLTKPGDKLVAFSGIARSIQGKTGDRYFAGLWREFLAEEIRWRASDPQKRPQYRAPSWSWAAVEGPIDSYFFSPQDGGIEYAHVLSVSIIHPGKDTFGAVLHGTLSLRCDLIVGGTIAAQDSAGSRRTPCSRCPQRDSDVEFGICFASLDQTGYFLPFFLDCAEQKDARVSQIVHYLPLRSGDFSYLTYNRHVLSQGSQGIFGIVLEEVCGTPTRYRRIGSFEYDALESPADGNEGSCLCREDYKHFMELCKRTSSCDSKGFVINIV